MSCRNSPRDATDAGGARERLCARRDLDAWSRTARLARRWKFPDLARRSGLVAETKPDFVSRRRLDAQWRNADQGEALSARSSRLCLGAGIRDHGALAREPAPAPCRPCGNTRALPFRVRARGRLQAFADEPC